MIILKQTIFVNIRYVKLFKYGFNKIFYFCRFPGILALAVLEYILSSDGNLQSGTSKQNKGKHTTDILIRSVVISIVSNNIIAKLVYYF